ncbi:5797_t:CDS:2 [Paraglomus brasilianum]|uniref:5797_t:CDS:1 n=1 Tax=Paraglomus brasilianum TaxID=144538 RepID=A0A9N8Z920_9GLOM|nr:5797_t:CDS:2 [Paraglomus brasilianum]
MNTKQRAHVYDLTKNQMNPWKLDPSQFHDLIKYLLNIGILMSTNEMEDIGNLLELGLQNISPATIIDRLVQNKDGPQESSFQVALYSALNSILPDTMVCLFET